MKKITIGEYFAKLPARTWLSRALSSSFSNVVARRTKCARQPCTFLLVTSPSIHRLKKDFTDRLNNKPLLICLLTTPPHLKHVATLPCNLSLIACFLTLMFYKVVWQHMQEWWNFWITTLLQIYQGIFQWKQLCKSVKIWQNYGHEFVASLFWPTLVPSEVWWIHTWCKY